MRRLIFYEMQTDIFKSKNICYTASITSNNGNFACRFDKAIKE